MLSERALTWFTAVLAVVVWRSARVARNSIFRKHPFPEGYYAQGNFDLDCDTLKGGPDLKYCEDATFWDHLDAQGNLLDHTLLISCDQNRKHWNTVMGPLNNPEPLGSLWVYQPDNKETRSKAITNPSQLTRVELKGYPVGHDFHPLGVEIYPSYAGNTSNVYVVNHARERTVIEQFTLNPSSPTVANYVRTLVSPYFHSANALALTSSDSFYVTNDHLFTRRLPYVGNFLPIIESVIALPLSWVSHIDLAPLSSSGPPIEAHKFSSLFVPFANGVAISPDGTQVAIASTTLAKIFFYERDPKTNDLKRKTDSVAVPFLPDNIRYTHDGTALLVTGHPHFPTLTNVAKGTESVAPSWVVSINAVIEKDPQLKGGFDRQAPVTAMFKVPPVAGREIKTIFQSDGSGFSSSSTALKDPVTGDLYVTGLYAEDGLLVCRPSSN